jgi:Ca-activated chloride channel family protein
MNFLRPEYLNLSWALLAIAGWCGAALYFLGQARKQLGGALYSLISRPSSLLLRGTRMALVLAALGCLILALARPQTIRTLKIPELRRIDAVILLDTSPSMRAEDIKPSRLFRATEVIGAFVRKKLAGDRVGLIAFANNSLVLSYPTGDPRNLLFYTDYLGEQNALQYGTNIGGALKSAMVMFSRQAEIEPGIQQNKRALILLSDGEDHGEELKAELRELVERHIPVFCVGIGSREGSLIPVGERNGKTQYLNGADGRPILTTFDESTLQEVAERTGGRYYRARTGMEMDQAFNDIFVKAREITGYRRANESHERYQELLAAALVLFLIRVVI